MISYEISNIEAFFENHCPRCGAQPGKSCRRPDRAVMFSMHSERYKKESRGPLRRVTNRKSFGKKKATAGRKPKYRKR